MWHTQTHTHTYNFDSFPVVQSIGSLWNTWIVFVCTKWDKNAHESMTCGRLTHFNRIKLLAVCLCVWWVSLLHHCFDNNRRTLCTCLTEQAIKYIWLATINLSVFVVSSFILFAMTMFFQFEQQLILKNWFILLFVFVCLTSNDKIYLLFYQNGTDLKFQRPCSFQGY